jgi:hypothetical protein
VAGRSLLEQPHDFVVEFTHEKLGHGFHRMLAISIAQLGSLFNAVAR